MLNKTLTTLLFLFTVFFLSLIVTSSRPSYAGGTCGTESTSDIGYVCLPTPNNCNLDTPVCGVSGGEGFPCSFSCTGCTSSSQCSGFSGTPYCNIGTGACVECNSNADCEASGKTDYTCNSSGQCIPPSCTAPGGDCVYGPSDLIRECCSASGVNYTCNTATERCELESGSLPTCECAGSGDCESLYSETWECVPNSAGNTVCTASGSKNGICIDQPATASSYNCVGGTNCSVVYDTSGTYPTISACIAAGCASAAPPPGDALSGSGALPSPLDPGGLIERIVLFLIPIAILIALFRIIQGGYLIITSEGSETKISEGKEILTSAVVGLIFSLAGLAVLRVLINTFIGI